MDETKEPVNDRNELTNLHYTSRQYIDHHTEDKKNNAICTGYIYCQFDCLLCNIGNQYDDVPFKLLVNKLSPFIIQEDLKY